MTSIDNRYMVNLSYTSEQMAWKWCHCTVIMLIVLS